MGTVVRGVLDSTANVKRRATLRGGAASLHATAGRVVVTSAETRRTLAVRTIRSTEGEGA
ncbi:hypothetical protein ABII15_33140 [Streptomyces sp. HUAS MG91]|uniref:Uncharacterized protein n=1 Tax=Streptomyces tabacisoli TaxID=3156398 RepID=A0AAU8J269_9ACTN